MMQQKVYSKEWFNGLELVDRPLSRQLRSMITARKSLNICLVCKNFAHRDYAVVGAKFVTVIRLCGCCHGHYVSACGRDAVLPFVGRI